MQDKSKESAEAPRAFLIKYATELKAFPSIIKLKNFNKSNKCVSIYKIVTVSAVTRLIVPWSSFSLYAPLSYPYLLLLYFSASRNCHILPLCQTNTLI